MSILMIAPPVASLSWLLSFSRATCLTLSLRLGYGLLNLFAIGCAHRMPLSLYYKVVSFILIVYSQPSFGYCLSLSLRQIVFLELCQLINFGYSTSSLPFIWAIALLKVFNHLLFTPLFHSAIYPLLLTQELCISWLNLFLWFTVHLGFQQLFIFSHSSYSLNFHGCHIKLAHLILTMTFNL